MKFYLEIYKAIFDSANIYWYFIFIWNQSFGKNLQSIIIHVLDSIFNNASNE